MLPVSPDPAALAAWNDANARARAEYRRDPFAASREMAHGQAANAYQNGAVTLAELVITQKEIRSW